MEFIRAEQWSPYLVGAVIGVLSWVSFVISDKPLGCSTAFARTGGMIERILRGKQVEERPYYKKFAPAVDWEWMLVLGVIIGFFLSSCFSGQFIWQWVPGFWSETIGTSVIGGLIFGVGFGVLGYCPGTVAAAVGTGALDALLGGVVGILLGAWLFALVYPKLQNTILSKMDFGELTLPQLFKVNQWIVVVPVAILIILLLLLIAKAGL